MADLTASDELPAGIMRQWAEEELRRDAVQWQPRRELPDQAVRDEEEEDGGDDAGDALEFRDIKGSLLGPCEPNLSPQHLALADSVSRNTCMRTIVFALLSLPACCDFCFLSDLGPLLCRLTC